MLCWLAMLARMSWVGWAGQVRLAGDAFIFSPVVVVVVVVEVLLLSLLLFLGFVRWFLDASFHVTFLTHNCNLGEGYGHFWCPKPVIWQAWCLHFCTLGDHGTIQGHLGAQERRSWGQAWIFIDFEWISGPHFESFPGSLDQHLCVVFMLVCRTLFQKILGSESGRLGLQKQAFGVRWVAKTNFSQKSEF